MGLETLDWVIILALCALTLIVGLWASTKANRAGAYFLAERKMPWWLLGISMVATTFSTDTPNLVTNIVRTQGVAGNWTWWCFLITGMLTAFVYARLWRTLGVTTDIEFYELRYQGRIARFLRMFRAVYLGVFFNVMIMGAVTLAAVKISGVVFGVPPEYVVLGAGAVAVIFSAAGGLLGVLITDLILFVTAMAGSILAAYFALAHPAVGGLEGLLNHPLVEPRAAMFPDFGDPVSWVPLLLVPLALQWWSVWYPGSEPGGGGYVAQRMLSAKNERHAMGAVALFNVAHYVLRPWPWIIVALASLIVFPDLGSLKQALPQVDPEIIGDDLAYPAMLMFMPPGALGLVVASLICAYISTVSSHLNWGASYVANDVYARFMNPNASTADLVRVGRLATIALMFAASMLALILENALQAFRLLLTVGAGTGLLFLLRWFWLRINAWSELAAMAGSFFVTVMLEWLDPAELQGWARFAGGVALTTVLWVAVTFLTPRDSKDHLEQFKSLIAGQGSIRRGLLCALLASIGTYGLLFATGSAVYGKSASAICWSLVAIIAFVGVLALRPWNLRHAAMIHN